MEWGDYEPFDLGIDGPLSELPRREARAAFRRWIDAKTARVDALAGLAARNGIALGDDDASVQALNDWYVAEVEADPDREPGWLTPHWYSVSDDIAMFLGDLMIRRHPALRWEFHVWGRRNIAYHEPVIMGFRARAVSFDLRRIVASYGHGVIGSQGSVRRHGVVLVRGVLVDVDEALSRQEPSPVEPAAFTRWLATAAPENDHEPMSDADFVKAMLGPDA